MQVQHIGSEQQRFVGVVPNQVFHRVNLGIAGHQNSAGHSTQLVVHRGVNLFAHVFQNAKQGRGFLGVGVLALAGKIPGHKFVVCFGTEKTPRHNAAGVDEMLYKVIGFGDRMALKGGWRQIVQPFKAATLQQLGQAAL